MYIVAITGSNGVLGKTIADFLESSGNKVFRLHHSLEETEKIFSSNGQKIDVVIHCAFSRSEEIGELVQSIDFSAKIFELCKHYKISRIINISSQSVYLASREDIWTEETTVAPLDLYGMAKYIEELLCNVAFEGTGLQYTSIRLASLIGYGMEQRVVTKLIRKMMNREKIIIQAPEQNFQYLDIRDAALGIISLLKTDGKVWKTVYCLGPKGKMSLKEIAENIESVMTENHYNPLPIEYSAKSDTKSGIMSSEVFNKTTGWTEKYDLKETIKSILSILEGKRS